MSLFYARCMDVDVKVTVVAGCAMPCQAGKAVSDDRSPADGGGA